MAKKTTTSWQTIVVTLLVGAMLVGLLGVSIFSNFGSITKKEVSTRELALSCTTDMATQFHIHPHLDIYINGAKQTIPTNTGIDGSCMHPIHTHDDSGTIHVESPEKRDFTLGDFFAVWNQPFSKDQIFASQADATHEVVMTVNGEVSTAYENLVLRDLDQIVIYYQKKGTPLPKSTSTSAFGDIQVKTTGGTVKVSQ